jgi:single-stranded DNA-binding protein
MVEGHMELDQWQDKQSGAKRSRLKVVAENVQFLRIKKPDDDPLMDPATSPAPDPAAPLKTSRRPARPVRAEA